MLVLVRGPNTLKRCPGCVLRGCQTGHCRCGGHSAGLQGSDWWEQGAHGRLCGPPRMLPQEEEEFHPGRGGRREARRQSRTAAALVHSMVITEGWAGSWMQRSDALEKCPGENSDLVLKSL